MALITDYTTLQSTVIEYLARDQDTTLAARIPTFVQLSEAKFNRTLFTRQMETRSTALTDPNAGEPEFIALPADFQSMRRIRLSSVTGKPLLEFKTPVALDEFRQTNANAAGQPVYFTIFGSEIEIAPTPDKVYTIEMIYRQNVPPLATYSTNWLLTLAPDLYLYSVLMESAPYLKEDERIATWALGYKTSLDGVNSLGMTSTFNAGPLTVRPSGNATW